MRSMRCVAVIAVAGLFVGSTGLAQASAPLGGAGSPLLLAQAGDNRPGPGPGQREQMPGPMMGPGMMGPGMGQGMGPGMMGEGRGPGMMMGQGGGAGAMMGHGYDGRHYDGFHRGFHVVIWGIFLVVLAAVGVAATRLLWRAGSVRGTSGGAAALLDERYARGEVGRDEFLQKKKDLA